MRHASNLSPYTAKLIPFQPVDSVDTRYGQIYKPIPAHQSKEAGLKVFSPNQPFKVATNLAQTDQCNVFHWLSLSELNDEITPFLWASNEEYECYMSGGSVSTLLMLTTGPPPVALNHSIPSVPAIHFLMAAIIKSTDQFFFVSHNIGANEAQEWRLAWVDFNDSLLMYPACTLDGQFLFKFYICHPADWQYNAVNQRYWFQFHGWEDITHPSLSTETHLVQPSDTFDDYAQRHNLLSFWKWLNIAHLDIYTRGPFEFAAICGRKTNNRISQDDWVTGTSFGNMLPCSKTPYPLSTFLLILFMLIENPT